MIPIVQRLKKYLQKSWVFCLNWCKLIVSCAGFSMFERLAARMELEVEKRHRYDHEDCNKKVNDYNKTITDL